MKKILFKIVLGLIVLTLLAVVFSRVFNYSDEVKQMINTVMFSLVGVGYLLISSNMKKEINKSVFVVCGAYLIIMNFIELNTMFKVIGMLSIALPLLVSKFSGEKIRW